MEFGLAGEVAAGELLAGAAGVLLAGAVGVLLAGAVGVLLAGAVGVLLAGAVGVLFVGAGVLLGDGDLVLGDGLGDGTCGWLVCFGAVTSCGGCTE